MSDWVYDQAQIETWARFSGDFNPIHFDLERAREIGSPEIVVHGMLPLLRLKQELAEAAGSGEGWLHLKCRLKQPLQRGASHGLALRGGRFTLRADAAGTECVQGSFSRSAAEPARAPADGMVLSVADLPARLAAFRTAFPGVRPLWIALDAIVFSHFLTEERPFALARDHGFAGGAHSQAELMQGTAAVQTLHAVSVAPSLLARTLDAGELPHTLHCVLAEPAVVRNSDVELAGAQPIDVLVDGQRLMQLEIGLLLRSTTPSTEPLQ